MRTSVHDTAIVNVSHGCHNCTNEVRSVAVQAIFRQVDVVKDRGGLRLKVIPFGAYTVEELASRAEIETEIKIVGGLMMGAW